MKHFQTMTLRLIIDKYNKTFHKLDEVKVGYFIAYFVMQHLSTFHKSNTFFQPTTEIKEICSLSILPYKKEKTPTEERELIE